MRLDLFTRLIDTHGADPARWPPAQRPAALALLEASAEARALRDDALALDAALRDSLPGPDAAALARMRGHLARAVARSPLPQPESVPAGLLRWFRPWAPAGCGALLTLAVCGVWLSRPAQPEPDEFFGAPRLLAMMESTP